ncbi:MAG: hypothetical protein R3B48_16775 [Kofleriaceae bacterium]
MGKLQGGRRATCALTIAAGLVVGAVQVAAAEADRHGGAARGLVAPRGPAVRGPAVRGPAVRGPRPAVIFLNGAGATLRGGLNDPVHDRAIVLGEDQRVEVPAFSGAPEAWARIVACVREELAPFAIDVVTERPRARGYAMVMIGGVPSLVQQAEQVAGVTRQGDGRAREIVALVFSEALKNDVTDVCNTVLHETGHILGLDHVYGCEDPMSYLSCGEKHFQMEALPCGEEEPRSCSYVGGRAGDTQSSALLLAEHVGWRGGAPPRPRPSPELSRRLPVLATLERVVEASSSLLEQELPGAQVAPTDAMAISVLAQPRQRGHGFVEIVVEVTSDRYISDAALRWVSAEQVLVFSCGHLEATPEISASCHRQGRVFTFRVRGGYGARELSAVAYDLRELWLVSGRATIELTP